MALYYYDKYHVANVYDFNWGATQTIDNYTEVDGYSGYYLDDSSLNSYVIFGDILTTTDGQYVYSSNLLSSAGDSGEVSTLYRFWFQSGSCHYQEAEGYDTGQNQSGLFIEKIVAEDGEYPDDGEQGGYWYTKQGVAPTTPNIISPNGGEEIDAEYTIEWEELSDLEGDSLTYQIQLRTTDGDNWRTIVPDATGSSYTYDFSDEDETSTCLVRIRTYDGYGYSDWDESDDVFAINHNNPPDEPTNLNPSGGESHDQNRTIRLSWQHNDDDTQSAFDLQWRVKGDSTWNEINQNTNEQYHDVSGGVFPSDDIEWRVKTYDQEGLESPWSDTQLFFAGQKPSSPTIIEPSDDVGVANPTMEWSSSDQDSYDLRIFENGKEVYQHGGSTNKAHKIQMDLSNQTMYELRLSITNSDGLVSDVAIQSFYVDFTEPPQPEITLSTNDSGIVISFSNPDPTGSEPNISYNNVYRRTNDDDWVRIATDLTNNNTFTDYAVASNQVYDYYVRARGDNGTYSDGEFQSQSVTFKSVWLHDVLGINDPHQFKADGGGRDHEWLATSSRLQFAGRKHSVTEFSQHEDDGVDISLRIDKNSDDYEALNRIVKAKNIICYRDGRGRKIFGTITNLSTVDETYGYSVQMRIDRSSYDEEV